MKMYVFNFYFKFYILNVFNDIILQWVLSLVSKYRIILINNVLKI